MAYVLDTLALWFYMTWSYATPSSQLRQEGAGGAGFGVSLVYSQPNFAFADTRAAAVLSMLPPALHIEPHGLLRVHSFAERRPLRQDSWASYQGVACPTGEDPLAGIFYCLSLWAEYGEVTTDAHDRMQSDQHPLVQRGLVQTPLADRLAMALMEQLYTAAGVPQRPQWRQEPGRATSDIDAPTAFAHASPVRRLRSWARGVASDMRRLDMAPRRWVEWLRADHDPFDTFAYMAAQLAERGLQQDAFTLVGYGTTLDPGYPKLDKRWATLWAAVAKTGRLGLHPSYHSVDQPELLAEEKQLLEQTIASPVTISRQHFLRLQLPQTFRLLLEVGIREEHSLLWADRQGFRAGTARSFYWYDLERDVATDLLLVPPHGMDVTARYYNGDQADEAVLSWCHLAREAELSGTRLRVIWHNSNLGNYGGWWAWRKAYAATLDLTAGAKVQPKA